MKPLLRILAVMLGASISLGAAVLPAEKLLPDDTLFLLTVPDIVKAKELYKASPQIQLWDDPAMKPFKDKFMEKFKGQFFSDLEHQIGLRIDDYTNLLQGQLTFAITQGALASADKKDQEPAMLLMLDTKDAGGQLKTNLADLKKKWVDSGKPIRTEKIRDVEFSIVTISGEDFSKTLKKPGDDKDTDKDKDKDSSVPQFVDADGHKVTAGKQTLYIGQAESLLILATSGKPLEGILAAMSGSSAKSLEESPEFAANQNSLFRNAPAYGWVNLKTIIGLANLRIKADREADDGPSILPVKPDAVMAALGLNGITTFAFNVIYAPEGAQFNMFLGAPESQRAGLIKMIAGESKDVKPPAFVPADAVKFQRWRIDGQKLWASLQKMLNDISPQYLNGLNFALSTAETAAKEKDPDFDLKKNLFGNLGDDLIIYSKAPKSDSIQELNNAPSIILVGSPNAEKLAAGLKSIFALTGQMTGKDSEREFLGRKIYTLDTPAPPAGPAGGAPKKNQLCYAYSAAYLAISSDAAMIEEYLRNTDNAGKSLAETAGLAGAEQRVIGDGTSLFGYSNESETMRVTIEAMKKVFANTDAKVGLMPTASLFGLPNAAAIKEWLDFTLLPNYDQISKYFYFSVYSGSASADGLTWKFFSPVPPQLKQ